jgi:hypothetical protein
MFYDKSNRPDDTCCRTSFSASWNDNFNICTFNTANSRSKETPDEFNAAQSIKRQSDDH